MQLSLPPSQYIKGDADVNSDQLSFAGNIRSYDHPLALHSPSDAILTQRFRAHLPQLIPEDFVISPLPREIFSFIIQALQMTELSLNLKRKNPTRTRPHMASMSLLLHRIRHPN
jgi:hypothetical protein